MLAGLLISSWEPWDSWGMNFLVTSWDPRPTLAKPTLGVGFLIQAAFLEGGGEGGVEVCRLSLLRKWLLAFPGQS